MNISGASIKIKKEAIIISLSSPWKVLSSAIIGGGSDEIKHIIITRKGPKNNLGKTAALYDLGKNTTGTISSSDLKNAAFIRKKNVGAIALKDALILLIDSSLTRPAMVNAVKISAEARTKAFTDLDVRDGDSCSIIIASSGRGKAIKSTGAEESLNLLISQATSEAVKKTMQTEEDVYPNRPMVKRLKERGIFLDDLVKSALELFVPHKGLKSKKKASGIIRKMLLNALLDINVSSLIIAGLRLEEDGSLNLIPGLTRKEFKKDVVSIVADEILGMAIAEYIGGTRARFEYVRYDRRKPGILKRLGPFEDDVICGLISGVSSKMYSEAVE